MTDLYHRINDPALLVAYRYYRDGEESKVFADVEAWKRTVDAADLALRVARSALAEAETRRDESRARFASSALSAAGLPPFVWGNDEAFAYTDDDGEGLTVVVRPPAGP